MAVTIENLNDVVTYHKPSDAELEQIARLRAASRELMAAILLNTPACADQSAALRHVREALMTANAAVVLRGLV